MVQLLLRQKSFKLPQQHAALFFLCHPPRTALSLSSPFTLPRFLQTFASLGPVPPLTPSLDSKLLLLRQESFSPSQVKILHNDKFFLAASCEKVSSIISFLRAKGIVGAPAGIVLTRTPVMLAYRVESLERKCKFFEDLGIAARGLERILKNGRHRFVFGISTETLQKRIDFLERVGLDKRDIVKIVCSFPSILLLNVERKMEPTMAFFERHGMSKDDFLRVVRAQPRVFRLSIDRYLTQKLEFVRGLGLDLCTKSGAMAFAIFCSFSREVLLSKWEFLKRQGFSEADVRYMVLARPRMLAMSKDALKRKVDYVKNVLNGIDIGTRRGVRALKAFGAVRVEVLLCRWEFLKREGFCETAVRKIVMIQPTILTMREESLKRKIDYVQNVLNRDLGEVAKYPAYFSLSLGNRVIPRFRFLNELKEKGESVKTLSLSSLLSPSDEAFEKRFGNGYRKWKAGYKHSEAKDG